MEHWISNKTLSTIQVTSGVVFGSFSVLHLTNTSSAIFGHLFYDGAMDAFRNYYQNRFVEPVVVGGALTAHVGSSMLRVYRRWKKNKKIREVAPDTQSGWGHSKSDKNTTASDIHRYSGYILSGLVFFHIGATRIVFLNSTPADSSLIYFSLKEWPLIFYPYYTLLSFSGFYHSFYGSLKAAKYFGIDVPEWLSRGKKRTPFWLIIGVGSTALAAGILALGGLFESIPTTRFPEFQKHAELWIPTFLHSWLLGWKS